MKRGGDREGGDLGRWQRGGLEGHLAPRRQRMDERLVDVTVDVIRDVVGRGDGGDRQRAGAARGGDGDGGVVCAPAGTIAPSVIKTAPPTKPRIAI